jgi:predicted metal-dependent phosphoesterase TrpH
MNGNQFPIDPFARPLKVDLHVHTSADPVDNLPLDAVATVELAAVHGYDAIALTHHDAYFEMSDEVRAASERTGVLVIPGIEASLDDGAHVLVVNCGRELEGVSSLDELAAVRRPEQLIVPAPPL